VFTKNSCENLPTTINQFLKVRDNYPSIAKIVKLEGEEIARSEILKGVIMMLDGLPHEIGKDGFRRVVRYIMDHYKLMTCAELNIVGDNLMLAKEWKINIKTIIQEIEKYWNKRLELAAEMSQKKHIEDKKEIYYTDDFINIVKTSVVKIEEKRKKENVEVEKQKHEEREKKVKEMKKKKEKFNEKLSDSLKIYRDR